MTPEACRKESAVLDWISLSKPFYVFSFSLRIKMILRTQLRGSGAFSNVRGRRGRWEAHRTLRQAYTSTQISQNVVCIYSYVEQKAVCLLVSLSLSLYPYLRFVHIKCLTSIFMFMVSSRYFLNRRGWNMYDTKSPMACTVNSKFNLITYWASL